MREELQGVRNRSDQLERRLDRMEMERSILEASQGRRESSTSRPEPVVRPVRRAPAQLRASELAEAEAGAATRSDDEGEDAPPGELVIVQLHPNHTPAPKLATRVSLKEPDAEMRALLATPSETAKAGATTTEASQGTDVERAYDTALADLRDGRAKRGISRLQQLAKAHPEHALADNALYFSGVGLMGLGEYRRAADAFAAVIADHPTTDAVPQSLLRLAECRTRLSQHDAAKLAYRQVVTSYPGTDAAQQAEQRLASLSGTK